MEQLYSIRMRANKENKHISGAERIIREQELDLQLQKLVARARNHSLGEPEEINLTIEKLDSNQIETISALPITTVNVTDYQNGREELVKLLVELGIKKEIADKAINLLKIGPNLAGGNMRGAVVMDLETGARLESDKQRGIRATKMDYQPQIKSQLQEILAKNDLNQSHLPEALVLASKVVNHPDIIAELCCTDDPDYQAGYLASTKFGYCRFPYLKPKGVQKGGRVFFVQPQTDLEQLKEYLEQTVVMINRLDTRVRNYSTVDKIINWKVK